MTPSRTGLLGAVADRFDVVAVRVADEGAVVIGVVLRPDAGLVQHLGAGSDGGGGERVDGRAVGRRERDVRLPEAVAGRLLADPELRLAVASVPDGAADL